MSASERYNGASTKVYFKNSSGTADLSGDYRNLSVTRTQNTWDATAAADGAEVNKATYKAFSATLDVMSTGTAGTAAFNIAALGAEGTLEYAPQGTATGKPKGSFPVIITEQPFSISYNDGAMTTITFAGQGDEIDNPFVDVY